MKKFLALALSSLIVMQTLALTEVSAGEIELTQSTVESVNTDEYKIQRADVIVIMTRTFNGVRQYRRWNQTRNKWVDSYWRDM